MKLLTWGLSDEQIAAVSVQAPDAEVERLTALPEHAFEGLLIVSAAASDKFVQWAEKRMMADGIQPSPVLLYLPSDAEEPEDGWEYFDGTVSDDDWDRLDTLLECPHVLDAELAAADVRTNLLRGRSVADVRVADIVFGNEEWDRSDSAIRQHLATCVTCRVAFNEALEWRIELSGGLLQTALKEWLPAIVVQIAELQAAQEQRRQTVLAAVLNGLMGAQLRACKPLPLVGTRGESSLVTADDIPALLARLREGATFVRPHRQLTLQLKESPQGDMLLTVTDLLGELANKVNDFRLTLRRGEETLWGADSVDGKVSLPLTALEKMLEEGDVQLVILTQGEEG